MTRHDLLLASVLESFGFRKKKFLTGDCGIRTKKIMKQTIEQLKSIIDKMNAIGEQMRAEAKVWEAELADRKAKGITDDKESIEHYNEWMKMFGMEHLMVK